MRLVVCPHLLADCGRKLRCRRGGRAHETRARGIYDLHLALPRLLTQPSFEDRGVDLVVRYSGAPSLGIADGKKNRPGPICVASAVTVAIDRYRHTLHREIPQPVVAPLRG